MFEKFPVQNDSYISIPMIIIKQYEKQLQNNHHQTAERLAERGGLTLGEIYLILTGERLPPIKYDKWDELHEKGRTLLIKLSAKFDNVEQTLKTINEKLEASKQKVNK